MLIRTYLVLITTKNGVIRCLSVPTWSQKFEEHLVGIIQHCSAFACDESNLDEKASKETFRVSCHFREFLLIAANHEERSDSMLGSTYLVRLST
jgi:hypothetical protein